MFTDVSEEHHPPEIDPEDKGTTFFRHVGIYLPDYTT
jgi:hypothetical protein